MKKQIITITLSLILVGAGCSKSAQKTIVNAPAAHDMPQADMHQGVHSETAHAKLAGSRLDLENRNSFKPGQVHFAFKLYGLDGHEFGADELKVAHEKKMHFIVVRDDLQGFQHLHPEYTNGKWSVGTTIADEGQYNVYIDIEPTEERPVTLRVPVTIGKPETAKQFPAPNKDMKAQNGSYDVALQISQPLHAGEDVPLAFAVTNKGKPESNLQPYLGAFGHVVLLREGEADDYFHVHPVTVEKPTDGIVKFEASFPEAGRYTLFAQFNTTAGVKTFPITVDVAAISESGDHTQGAASAPTDMGHAQH